ncbi:hypothetical protein [Pelagibius marinus]|uniref:hypothetical protein n=1 Tax=Pelagibius marinus TaxID=2762760 RepID=UPI0018726487|nr:hypothetical protein [Pelagibius marinus]
MSAETQAAAAATRLPVWPTVRGAYAGVLTNLWPLTKLAAPPLLVALAIPLTTAPFDPITTLVLFQLVGRDTAYLLEIAGIHQMIDFALLLIPFSYFAVKWLHFLRLGQDLGAATSSPGAGGYLLFLRLSPLLFGIYPAIVFLNQIYIAYGYVISLRTSLADPVSTLLVQPHWIYGLVAGTMLEIVIVARFAPAFATAAYGAPVSLRAAWRSTRGQTFRHALIWLLTYRLAWFVFAYSIASALAELQIPDRLSFHALFGGGSLEERMILASMELPLIAAMFAVIALGLGFLADVRRPSSPRTLAAFD